MTHNGVAALRIQEEHLSDAQLRAYEFETCKPEQVDGWTAKKPGSDTFKRVVQTYNVPHQKYSRDQMVWCCYCQERNHFEGGVAEFASGDKRTVGWKCGIEHLDVRLKNARADLSKQKARKAYLLQADKLRVVLPILLNEVESALQSETIRAFSACRQNFRIKLEPLYMKLSAAAFHDKGVLEWDLELADYSRTETTREALDDKGQTKHSRKLAGQRRVFKKHRKQMIGWRFVDPRTEPATLLERSRNILLELNQFYSITATDTVDTNSFHRHKVLLEQSLKWLEEVEGMLASLPAFFRRENRELVVWYRNHTMAGRNVYRVIPGGFGWTNPDGDEMIVVKPDGYKSLSFAKLPEVRGTLARA